MSPNHSANGCLHIAYSHDVPLAFHPHPSLGRVIRDPSSHSLEKYIAVYVQALRCGVVRIEAHSPFDANGIERRPATMECWKETEPHRTTGPSRKYDIYASDDGVVRF